MNIIKIFFFLFLFSSFLFATRIDISYEKMKEINSNYFFLYKTIIAGVKHSYSTKHFNIYWGDEYPATTLWADYNKDKIPDFITDTASILENVWNIEINKFGFKAVEYPVNVYISNTGMYLNGYPLNLDEGICGYAVYDQNTGEKYIVVNSIPPASYSTPPLDMLKITLAHEFFHLVQYGYNSNLTDINRWLYEGTAVLMEHLVYPKITDYIDSYADTIFNYPNYGFMNFYSLSIYSSVFFFDYLEKKFGLNFIKDIWKNFSNNIGHTSLYDVNLTLNDYNSSINKEIYNFYYNLEHNLSVFSNSDILNDYAVTRNNVFCDFNYTENILPTGALFVNSYCNNVSFIDYDFNKSYISYNKKTFAVNNDDFIINLPKNLDEGLYVDKVYFRSKNDFFKLEKGWNLVTFKNDVNLSDYNFSLVWMYKNNKWYGFSKNTEIKNYFVKHNMYTEKVSANDGVWIYSDKLKDLNIKVKKGEIDYNLTKGWYLISFPSYIDLNLSFFSNVYKIKQIWVYDNDKWKFFSNDMSLQNLAKEKGYNLIKEINEKGFWAYKN
jgi:hypothetical protein